MCITNRDVHVESSLIFAPFRLVIKAGPVRACVCACVFVLNPSLIDAALQLQDVSVLFSLLFYIG